MQSQEIRKAFLDFFESKGHQIVPSAPIVQKNDPSLLFTNAGMNPFKDIFLGNQKPKSKRVADTQKCLRASGKHNDLEEVGVDTYHHTMFEMLGNWSFGDYFKEEAIDWAWELITQVFKVDADRLYATVFEGDAKDKLDPDTEAESFWAKYLPADRILRFDRKDNFWEMGETGPCGPCSELHVDMRSDEERSKVDGASLVNMDHPQVIEIWNLVFIAFQRMADRSLVELPEKHVDTGMGFERLCMVLQGASATYDTDIFAELIAKVEALSGKNYGTDEKTDIAIRVMVDHIRSVSFSIADGQLPGNVGAGHVIRRILRRAVRYAYSFLDISEPSLYLLFEVLVQKMGDAFPELSAQAELIQKVILEEEKSFLRTLASGLKKLDQFEGDMIDGASAFELYDTYGFPIDLTQLIASEKGMQVDMKAYTAELEAQKNRSREAAQSSAGDWVILSEDQARGFAGYDDLQMQTRILRYRSVQQKKKTEYQIVLDQTPFYAESGGQVGDQGILEIGSERIKVLDTRKENELIIHIVDKLPSETGATVLAMVDVSRRGKTSANHSATHLLHAALTEVLGDHVAQKGSYVGPDRLRFDFAHFSKVQDEELDAIQQIVAERIRQNIPKLEQRDIPVDEALASGARALFGEKYGDRVRVISFDQNWSSELCGGTHVEATGEIGSFRLVQESAVAAGVRRVEALTGALADQWIEDRLKQWQQMGQLLKSPKDPVRGLEKLQSEFQAANESLDQMQRAQLRSYVDELSATAELQDGVHWIVAQVDLSSADALKQLSFDLKKRLQPIALILGAEIGGKAMLSIMLDEQLPEQRGWNASQTIREAARHISGGGGGQPFYATAGGKNPEGIKASLEAAKDLLLQTATENK